ncbi:protein SERAC1 [Spodoptera frugiperda]|uniref:Protein SERAC1 n=1 Tax=Spodoptera frugiperda TaxID=7108 RepID=A0A9R0CYP8_SPOFR|nr:protein SERAC1 [Spodoptera frugiperda]
MGFQKKLRVLLRYSKVVAVAGSGVFCVYYNIVQTCKSINSIVNPAVVDRENKHIAEYIYVDDPSYNLTFQVEYDKAIKRSVGLARIWKSLKHSLAWRLLWLCRNGNKDQRNIALEQLASFKNNKIWDCCKLAQAIDEKTAVLLARTYGADLRYFLPPPIHIRRAALSYELVSFKLRDLIIAVQSVNPHCCIEHFLSKYFANVQEAAMESDSIPSKPDNIAERDLCISCMDAIYHHVTLFNCRDYEKDHSTKKLISMGLLPILAETLLRYRNDPDCDLAVLKVLTVLSVHNNLLREFFQNGLIGELSRLIRSKDIRLSSSAAVCLANLSGEHCYRPGLYLLHPIYRTTATTACDILLVHGLRGGVFVTWRQRDKKCAEPLGIIEVTVSDFDCESCKIVRIPPEKKYLDPDMQQVMEDLIEIEDEALLSDLEVVLHDLPIQAMRVPQSSNKFTANHKRVALNQEEEDKDNYTVCWPKDWLPKDISNLRILGVNYWTSLSEWLERCPLQTADIATRGSEMVPALIDAGVGNKSTPVVWLAHSMGGLIVKQVLVEASQSDQQLLKKIAENTKAVFFFSTPHKGSSMATMPRAAAAVLWPSNDVRQLQQDSPTLLNLHKAFIEFADAYSWETISFAETMPTLVTAFKVPVHFVESFSADLGRGEFYQLPLDHLCICKPATRQSILYTTVLDVLQRVAIKEEKIPYTNTFIQTASDLFWWLLRTKVKEVLETIDENQTNEGLRWTERVLLNTFTD